MSRKSVVLLATSSIATTVIGTVLVVAPSAAAGGKSHNVHFKATTVSSITIDNNESLSAAELRQRHHGKFGHKTGIVTFSCKSSGPGFLHCFSDFTLAGGQMFGAATVDFASSTISGRITDGTGAFKNASGTIKGRILRSGQSLLTVTYKA